jgi:Lon protease-like protein
MKLNRVYTSSAEMPATIPLFPLSGALLLPRRPIQLTLFEPRYLAMLDDALSGERLIGIVQPLDGDGAAGPAPALYSIGCAGRVVQYAEIGDGRCFLTLMGVARLRLNAEVTTLTPYRIAQADYSGFADDFLEAAGEDAVDRVSVIAALKRFAETNDVKVDWGDVNKASNEALVNGLSMMSPYGAREKQALLEAPDLKTRAEILVAVATMAMASAAGAPTQLH